MVGEGEHCNTMGGGATPCVCTYILYIDKHIIVTNGSITGLLCQPDQVSKTEPWPGGHEKSSDFYPLSLIPNPGHSVQIPHLA